ncbi:MAG TPA: hypothetical protein DEB05_12675 [Firmicutes bacterium]|jgi:polyferredoxin|nr:hypothetical protein [Bacillota bacterium]HBT17796.1 hypothetical protein [Bacillota bacterium]
MRYLVTGVRWLFFAVFVVLLATGKLMLWFGLYAVSLVAALFFGRIYCGYVCPMNTLMIPAEWISKKLKLETESTPKWLKKGELPWLFLVLSVAAMLFFKKRLGVNLPILPIWLVIAVLVTLRYKPLVFHNLVCPFGALQRIVGRFALFAKKVDPKACIGCKRCEEVCPSGAIAVVGDEKKAVINTALCHQCTNCQEVCPKDVIHFAK